MNHEDSQDLIHPVPYDGPAPLEAANELPADTLLDGVLILLVLTVMQRLVGFVREICFCRWLDAGQLGQWDMAFGFLMLAAPLAMFSLPGTFGRYVERYRQQGCLRSFLRRTALACTILGLSAAAAVYAARAWFSHLIFGRPDETLLVALLAGALVAVIAFTYLTCLLTALRNMRLVCGMELVNSLIFALLGITLMVIWKPCAASVVAAYGMACLLTSLGALWWLRPAWRKMPEIDDGEPERRFGPGCSPLPPGS